MMRVAMLEAPRRVFLRQVPMPSVRDGCVRIRIAACGICGTDVGLFEGYHRTALPYSLGHEYVGSIVEVGEGVRRFSPGQRVVVDPNAHCGHCDFCRRGQVHLCKNRATARYKSNGGLAEYTVASTNIVHHLPECVPFTDGACAEPLSCALHALDRARFDPGDSAAILGAGTMGLLMLQLLRMRGAGAIVVTEPRELRRERAAQLDASRVLNPLEDDVVAGVRSVAGDGVDLVVECSGRADVVRQALQLVKRGGTLLLVGLGMAAQEISLAPAALVANEVTIVGSILNPFAFSRAVELLREKRVRVSDLITPFGLDQVVDAIKAVRDGCVIKGVVVNPGTGTGMARVR